MSNLTDKTESKINGGNTVIMDTHELEERLRAVKDTVIAPDEDVIIAPDAVVKIFGAEDVTVEEHFEAPPTPAPQMQKRPETSENAKRILAEKAEEKAEKQRRRRTVTIIVLSAVLVLLLVMGSLVLRGAAQNRAYAEDFNAAQNYYYDGEYDKALEALRRAMQVNKTDECLLLMSACYEAKGDYVNAIAILESSKSGSIAVAERIETLKKAKEAYDEGKTVILCGEPYDVETTSLDLSGKRIRSDRLEDIGKLQQLTSLKLSDNIITDLDFLTPLKNLVSLDLSGNKISNLAPLSGMQSLRTLHLDNNEIKDYSPLYSLRGLSTLTISGMQISESQLEALKTALPDCIIFSEEAAEDVVELRIGGKRFMSDVKELDLSNCGLTDIYALSVCKNLTTLNISDNYISDLAPLMDMPELKILDASNNRISDIRPLLSLTKIEMLNLEGNSIGSIAALSDFSALKELYLKGNPVTNFAPLSKLANLSYLGLQNTGIDDAGLEKLYNLKHLKTVALDENTAITKSGVDALQKKLPDCKITHSELAHYIEIGGMKVDVTAESVNLSGLGITDVSALSQLTNVKKLDLSDNAIEDFSALYGLTTLTELDISGNPVSPEQLAALEAALPGCVVYAM